MKLQDQVVSLKLAKELKELGVKQESLFYWADIKVDELASGKDKDLKLVYVNEEGNYKYQISAFTCAELGEMLKNCSFPYPALTMNKIYRVNINGFPVIEDEIEANCRAKMLIYLLENKLITNTK